MMKKLMTLLLTGCMLLSMAACGTTEDVNAGANTPIPTKEATPTTAPTTEPTVTPTEAPEPTAAPTETPLPTEAPAVTEAPAPVAKTIAPLPVTIDMNNLTDCTVAVSIAAEDLLVDNTGARVLPVTVYAYDLYDMIDIAMLTVGDTIILRGEEVLITSLNTTDYGAVQINGGLDAGGYELRTDEHTVYYETGYSDVKTWFELGKVVLPVSADFVFTDNADPESDTQIFTLEDLFTDKVAHVYGFTPHNTRIVIEGGVVTRMERIYTP